MIPSVIAMGTAAKIDVTIVMPCLNEAKWLSACIANAKEALTRIRAELGLNGEILIADNGSADGSQLIARALGATLVEVAQPGYGAALACGMKSASGTFLVIGDADGSYDFRECVEMIRGLMNGADLCIGSRFKGAIKTNAMPWKNRYIGNPLLTGALNLIFGAGVSDAHCGLRALTKACFERLHLSGHGMEFASEMIIKAALKGEQIAEVPVTLSRDLRDRPPHLRPWRDGWRHLRYLLMLSPTWVFAVPATFAGAVSLAIWAYAAVATFLGASATSPIGNQWIILAGGMIGLSHIAGLLAAATHLYGTSQGYRRSAPWAAPMAQWISLESMLASGLAAAASGFAILLTLFGYWTQHGYTTIGTVLPAVTGTTLIVVGAQNILGGFLLAIINGHEAEFLKEKPESAPQLTKPSISWQEFPRAASR
ncbi:MAG TPA: glycosyltransferase family 2 protein [Methylocella sp.]|nr:glycosyltransferase family 2 protein [Methylocella sp.]